MLINLPLDFPFIFCHLVPSASSPPPLILSSPRFILYLSRMCALSLSLFWHVFLSCFSFSVLLPFPHLTLYPHHYGPALSLFDTSSDAATHPFSQSSIHPSIHLSIHPTRLHPSFHPPFTMFLFLFLSTKSFSFTSHSSLFQPHQQLLLLDHLCCAVDLLVSPCILIFSCHCYLLHIASVSMLSMHKASDRGFCHRLCTLLKASGSLIHVSWALWGLSGGGWELVASWRPFHVTWTLPQPSPSHTSAASSLVSSAVSLSSHFRLGPALLRPPALSSSSPLFPQLSRLCPTSNHCKDISTHSHYTRFPSILTPSPHSLMSDLIAFALTLGTV